MAEHRLDDGQATMGLLTDKLGYDLDQLPDDRAERDILLSIEALLIKADKRHPAPIDASKGLRVRFGDGPWKDLPGDDL